MKVKMFIISLAAVLILFSCVSNSSLDIGGASPGVVTQSSFTSIYYDGFVGDSDCGALAFVENNTSLRVLENMFNTAEDDDSIKYRLKIKTEGTGLNVKSTDNFNTFMGTFMGVLGTSFVVSYIGNDLNSTPVATTGIALSLSSVVFVVLALLPDKTTTVFDGKYTLILINAESGEEKYEESFTIDSSKKVFAGKHDEDENCVNEVNMFYSSVIRNKVIRIVEKGLYGGLE